MHLRGVLSAERQLREDGVPRSGDFDDDDITALRELVDEAVNNPAKLLFDMLNELHAAYGDTDPSSPGLVASCLKPGEYYAALHRFTEPYGKGKQTLLSVKGGSMTAVIRALDTDWRAFRARSGSKR